MKERNGSQNGPNGFPQGLESSGARTRKDESTQAN